MNPTTAYSWRAKILRWVDGDTVVVELDRGFEDYSVRTLRVDGIDAPDYRREGPGSREKRDEATQFARSLAPVGLFVQLDSTKGDDTEKYGRYRAKISLADGRDFAAVMIENGHAKPYDGGKR